MCFKRVSFMLCKAILERRKGGRERGKEGEKERERKRRKERKGRKKENSSCPLEPEKTGLDGRLVAGQKPAGPIAGCRLVCCMRRALDCTEKFLVTDDCSTLTCQFLLPISVWQSFY